MAIRILFATVTLGDIKLSVDDLRLQLKDRLIVESRNAVNFERGEPRGDLCRKGIQETTGIDAAAARQAQVLEIHT